MAYSRIPNKRKPRTKSAQNSSFSLRKLLFWLIAWSFVGVVGWVFLWLPLAQIAQIEVMGNQRVSSDGVRDVIWSELSGKYWEQVPRAQFVLVSKESIAQKVAQEFGQVRQVNVRKVFPDKLEIKIVEWERVYLWCSGSADDCNLLEVSDDGAVVGRAVLPSEKLVTDNLITRIIDMGGRNVDMQTTVFTFAQIEFIRALPDALADIGVLVSDSDNVTMTTPSRVAGYLRIATLSGWDLSVHTDQTIPSVVAKLSAVLEQVITPEQYSNIEYIDLRINNKVIYKLKNTPKTGAVIVEAI